MSDSVRMSNIVPDYTKETPRDEIDAYLTAYEELGFFSGAVLVARDGEVILNKGYGMANVEHNIPNTPYTKFRLASVTKAFTAAAVLLLQQRQLLEVGDPVSKYVPELRIRMVY